MTSSRAEAILPAAVDPERTTLIQTGAPAPDFELPDQDGEFVQLSSLRSGYVVVSFYPKTDRPG